MGIMFNCNYMLAGCGCIKDWRRKMKKIRKIYTLDHETVQAIENKRGLVTASAFVNDILKKTLIGNDAMCKSEPETENKEQ